MNIKRVRDNPREQSQCQGQPIPEGPTTEKARFCLVVCVSKKYDKKIPLRTAVQPLNQSIYRIIHIECRWRATKPVRSKSTLAVGGTVLEVEGGGKYCAKVVVSVHSLTASCLPFS